MLQETDKILYVGFKGKNNSSFKLVDSMKGDHLFLTNSFEGVYRDIDILKNGWTVVTVDGKLSAHYENTILITDGEPEILTTIF